MLARQARYLIADTGYWIALFDPRDEHSKKAKDKVGYIDAFNLIVPWPTIYETLGTRFVKNRSGMQEFERVLKLGNVTLINDVPYRDDALEATFQEGRIGRRSISLCDMLIRLMIQDTNVRVDALLTFNVEDFIDVCISNRVEIL